MSLCERDPCRCSLPSHLLKCSFRLSCQLGRCGAADTILNLDNLSEVDEVALSGSPVHRMKGLVSMFLLEVDLKSIQITTLQSAPLTQGGSFAWPFLQLLSPRLGKG